MKNIETLNTIATIFGDIAAAARDERQRDVSLLCHQAVEAAVTIEGIDNRRTLTQLACRVQLTARDEPKELATYADWARGHVIKDLMPELTLLPEDLPA